MRSMVIGGIILVIALMVATYFVVGDSFSFSGDNFDYINSLTMLGGLAIISITVFVALKYINQIKNDTAGGELVEDKWDGIGEYKNAIPSGWGLMFIGTIVWMLWYLLVGYPTNQFSQIGQYNEETLEHQKRFEEKWRNISSNDLVNMGQSVFLVRCAPCHGADAEGINGKAQDLTVPMYASYGIAGLSYPIEYGKKGTIGTMPAFKNILSETQVKAVASYIISIGDK
ncbi:Cytochrome c oxidase subunit CcoP [hydrothermal vent metagenome]|uniref:Cytochrome c oxidase subunit CcoP n=1 Tax=hydrothermal vent metagenome TaxID=652676 RepID=A0A3B1E9G4_9ZZZZ